MNRLDKDTSGIVVFAKNEVCKKFLQDHWNEITTRKYMAIVEGVMKGKNILKHYVKESKTLQMLVTDKEHGKLAITEYKSLKWNKSYSLLEIQIHTGRKHQIRLQLSTTGHPIVGDKKYGSNKNPLGRMALHAYYLKINLPKKEIICESPLPKEMQKMFPKIEKSEK